jgi:hypothetical protein
MSLAFLYVEASIKKQVLQSSSDCRVATSIPEQLEPTRFHVLKIGVVRDASDRSQIGLQEVNMPSRSKQRAKVGNNRRLVSAVVDENVSHHYEVITASIKSRRMGQAVDDASVRNAFGAESCDRLGASIVVALDAIGLTTLRNGTREFRKDDRRTATDIGYTCTGAQACALPRITFHSSGLRSHLAVARELIRTQFQRIGHVLYSVAK